MGNRGPHLARESQGEGAERRVGQAEVGAIKGPVGVQGAGCCDPINVAVDRGLDVEAGGAAERAFVLWVFKFRMK